MISDATPSSDEPAFSSLEYIKQKLSGQKKIELIIAEKVIPFHRNSSIYLSTYVPSLFLSISIDNLIQMDTTEMKEIPEAVLKAEQKAAHELKQLHQLQTQPAMFQGPVEQQLVQWCKAGEDVLAKNIKGCWTIIGNSSNSSVEGKDMLLKDDDYLHRLSKVR